MDFWESWASVWEEAEPSESRGPGVRRNPNATVSSVNKRPKKEAKRNSRRPAESGGWRGGSWEQLFILFSHSIPGAGSEVVGQPLTTEIWIVVTVPGPSWADYYFPFLLLLQRFRDKGTEIPYEQRLFYEVCSEVRSAHRVKFSYLNIVSSLQSPTLWIYTTF